MSPVSRFRKNHCKNRRIAWPDISWPDISWLGPLVRAWASFPQSVSQRFCVSTFMESRRPVATATGRMISLDDFDDTMRARIDENRSTVDNRIAIITYPIFRRNVIVGYAIARKICSYAYITVIRIGWVMPLDDVAVEAGPLIDSEHPVHTADNAADPSP